MFLYLDMKADGAKDVYKAAFRALIRQQPFDLGGVAWRVSSVEVAGAEIMASARMIKLEFGPKEDVPPGA